MVSKANISMTMTKSTNFEKSLQELEQIVSTLEQGDLSLDQSLKIFEKGIKLTRQCQETLDNAEQKIETLINSNND